eukprot:Opistho-1_new@10724
MAPYVFEGNGDAVFGFHLFRDVFHVAFLETPVRQLADPSWSAALRNIRLGILGRTETDLLQSRLIHGAKVMLRKNINVREGLTNGALGRVVRVDLADPTTIGDDREDVTHVLCVDT